jgi:hypothetical protein
MPIEHPVKLRLRSVELAYYPLRVADKRTAIDIEPDATPGPVEELHTELTFQARNGPCDRWLWHVKLVSRGRDLLVGGHGKEGPKIGRIYPAWYLHAPNVSLPTITFILRMLATGRNSIHANSGSRPRGRLLR